MNTDILMLKTYFGITSLINPDKAANQGFRLFQKVRKKDVRAREELFFDLARQFTVPFEKEPLTCFEMGDAMGDLVVLVHGWDSNAGSMSKLAVALTKKNKRVITFNLPGHANSKSTSTNLIECKEALLTILDYLDPKASVSIVSHSFGSAVTAYALAQSTVEVDKLVFLTNPNRINEIFQEFRSVIGLNNKAFRKLVKISEEKLGEPLDTLNVENNLQKFGFNGLLLIHDKHDKALPHYNSQQVNDAIENARLITLEHVGHYKMLWNDEVIARTVGFVNGVEVVG